MAYCDDCGCRTSNGICSNCMEELYIITYQGEYIDYPLSQEFNDKVNEQSKRLREQEQS